MNWVGLLAILGIPALLVILLRFWLRRRGIVLSTRWRGLYALSVWEKRLVRYAGWLTVRHWAGRRLRGDLPVCLKEHQSPLLRKLGNVDMELQRNKVANLSIAVERIDGLLVRPGERFSFWRTVGMPSSLRGFKEGLVLVGRETGAEVGGGLCQLSNLLYWMFLHSPLTVVERHRHGFDPFPDEGRVLPFGSGATVFYNYLDLQVSNDTEFTFQLRLWLTLDHLKGQLRCSGQPPYSYHLEEREHAFYGKGGKTFRRNQIWRRVVDRTTGRLVNVHMVTVNDCEVCYSVD